MRQFYVMLKGRRVGPYPQSEIAQAVKAGRIDGEALVIDELTEATLHANELADNFPGDATPAVHIPTSGGVQRPMHRAQYAVPQATVMHAPPPDQQQPDAAYPWALASFVGGLLSIALGCVLPLPILSVIAGAIALSKRPNGRDTAFSIIGIILGVVFGLVGAALLFAAMVENNLKR